MTDELTRDDVDSSTGALLLEFGASWCPHCQAAQPLIHEALSTFEQDITHHRIEDGKGKPLGRSFQVKLWPTLIALQDGAEIARVIRPQSADDVEAILHHLPNKNA